MGRCSARREAEKIGRSRLTASTAELTIADSPGEYLCSFATSRMPWVSARDADEANSRGRCFSRMELIGWIIDYLAMKGLRLKPTLQIEIMMALAIIIVLTALIYYGRLVWLLFSPD